MTEQWRDVVGYEGIYRVSDLGRVESVERTVQCGTWTRTARRRLLKPGTDAGGYKRVVLYGGERPSYQRVHTLVLLAFVGPRPHKAEARHIDGDASRSVLANLEWGSSSENRYDSVRHGTHPQARKTRCPYGHRLIGENIIWKSLGGRECRECHRKAVNSYAARKRAQRAAANQPTTEGTP